MQQGLRHAPVGLACTTTQHALPKLNKCHQTGGQSQQKQRKKTSHPTDCRIGHSFCTCDDHTALVTQHTKTSCAAHVLACTAHVLACSCGEGRKHAAWDGCLDTVRKCMNQKAPTGETMAAATRVLLVNSKQA